MNKFSHILKAFPNLLNLNVLLALRNLLHRFFKHALCMFVLSTSHVFISQLRIIQTTYDYNTYNIPYFLNIFISLYLLKFYMLHDSTHISVIPCIEPIFQLCLIFLYHELMNLLKFCISRVST